MQYSHSFHLAEAWWQDKTRVMNLWLVESVRNGWMESTESTSNQRKGFHLCKVQTYEGVPSCYNPCLGLGNMVKKKYGGVVAGMEPLQMLVKICCVSHLGWHRPTAYFADCFRPSSLLRYPNHFHVINHVIWRVSQNLQTDWLLLCLYVRQTVRSVHIE